MTDWLDYFIYSEKSPLIFSNFSFWVFFVFVIFVYQFIHDRILSRNLFLTFTSLYFYYLCGGLYFSLLIFSTLVDYYIGKWMYESDNPTKRKWLITASLVINLGLLAYYKYTYFFSGLLLDWFAIKTNPVDYLALASNSVFATNFDIHKIILPVGISFYTFQTLSYSLDIYRGSLKPVKNIWDFAFFVSFFPQLVAGPIVRAADFIPQIYEKYKLEIRDYGVSIFLILNGLIKKIFISDYVSTNFVDRIFENPTAFSGFENLMAVYGYTIQIYCDFSGYSDIAIGISLLLGFRLLENFNSPYQSTSITEFWRRWHISLSFWLRDYLYISLGGNRKGKIMTYLNLLATMLLGGLWHGAHFKFIIWGGLHGAALALHKLWLEYFKPSQNPKWYYNLAAGALTFHFVAFCWIFFRADTTEAVWQILGQIAFNFSPEIVFSVIAANGNIFSVMLLGFAIHWVPRKYKDELQNIFLNTSELAKTAIIVMVILLLYQVRSSDIQPFIYFQF